MKQNDSIQIRTCKNGYIVSNAPDYSNGGNMYDIADEYVFQTFAELKNFLSEHFTHRQDNVYIDNDVVQIEMDGI